MSSSGGGGGYQSSGRSSSRNSAPGYSSHTPSSASGSLSRYSSLTTPFYQPRQGGTPSRGCGREGTTPVNKSPKLGGSHSGTNLIGGVGSIPCQTSPGTVPFGQLIQPHPQHHHHQPVSYSPSASNVLLNSGGSHYRSYHSPIASPPFSTSPGVPSHHHHHHAHYATGAVATKGNLSRRNSGNKLSALAEEREGRSRGNKTTKMKGAAAGHNGGGGGGGDGGATEKTSSGGFDIITRSCLLGFSGDEADGSDGETPASELEEENFPLSLTMSLTDQEDDNEGEEHDVRSHASRYSPTMSGNAVQIVGSDAVRYAPAVATPTPRSSSGRGGTADDAGSGLRPRRAASFSHQHRSSQLSQQLAALHSKASSLSAHGDPFAPGFLADAPPPPPSPSAEIVALRPPFTFSSSLEEAKLARSRPLDPSTSREDEDERICFGSLNLASMKACLVLAREMSAMAKARQGPILLMSTSADLVSLLYTADLCRVYHC